MKRINKYLTTITLLYSICAFTQNEVKLEYIQAADYRGIHNFSDRPGIIHFSEPTVEGMDLYALKVFDKDLQSYEFTSYSVGRRSGFTGVTSNKTNSFIIYDSPYEEMIDLILVDANGKVKKEDTYSDDLEDLTSYGRITSFDCNEKSELIIARSYVIWSAKNKAKISDSGIEFLCFDMELKKLWTVKMKSGADKRGVVNQIQATENGWAIFTTTSSYATKYFRGNISFMNSKGMIQGNYPLYKEDSKIIMYPTEIKILGPEVLVSGPYYEGGWFKSSNSKGMFFASLNMSGEEQVFSKETWKNLNEIIDPEGTKPKTFKTNTKSVVHDIIKTEFGYLIISELYQKTGATGSDILLDLNDNSNVRTFILKDYLMMDISSTGRINSLLNYEKEPQNIRVNGYFHQRRTEELTHLLKKSGYFTYQKYESGEVQFLNVKNKKPSIYTLNLEGGKITELQSTKITPEVLVEKDPVEKEFIENSKLLSSLDKFSESFDKFGEKMEAFGEKLDYATSEVDQSFSIQQIKPEGSIVIGANTYSFLMDFPGHTFYIKKLQ